VPVRSLVKNALRMRPDRIIVGEIRSGEALDMLQAMNTGHQGSLTTVHANSPLEALFRIETMTLMADVELPLFAIRQQVEQALQVIVQQERLTDGTRKVVSIEIIEPVRSDSYQLVPLYVYDKNLKKFGWVGKDASINKLLAKNNLSVNPQWKS
jgi:pilus assembly protein CpaF